MVFKLKQIGILSQAIFLSLLVFGIAGFFQPAKADPNCIAICANSNGWDPSCSVASYYNPNSGSGNPDYPCVCNPTSGNVCGVKTSCAYNSSCDTTGDTSQSTCSSGYCNGTIYKNTNDLACNRATDNDPCSDSNSCTYSDTCSGGNCSGSDYSCTPNECQTGGSCEGDGSCSFTSKSSGTACSVGVCDGSGSCGAPTYTYDWKTDASWGACDSSCSQSRSVWCERNDGQHVTDSFCSGAKPDDSQACSDGTVCDATGTCSYVNSCSQAGNLLQTTCNAGVCNGAVKTTTNSVVCNRATDNDSCSDINSCTYSDTCSGGSCSGSDYSCTPNECQTGGSCNGDGTCTFTNKPSGTSCSVGVCNGAGACGASGCSYTITNPPSTLSSAGGSGSVSITTASGCSWLASGSASWFTVSPASGTGNGNVTYTFAPYPNGPSARTAEFAIGDKSYTVSQSPASASGCFVDTDCPTLNPCDIMKCNTSAGTCYVASSVCRLCSASSFGNPLPSRFFCTNPSGSQGIKETDGVTCLDICNQGYSASNSCNPALCYPASGGEQYNQSANGPVKCKTTCTDINGGTTHIGVTVCQDLSLTGLGRRCDTGNGCILNPTTPKTTTFSTGYLAGSCSGSGYGGPGVTPGPVCGNGIVEGTESCDPPGTFCSSSCQLIKSISVDAVPTSQDIIKPSSGTNSVTYTIMSGYSSASVINNVKLTISGCPAGATCQFPNSSNTITLPFNALKSASTTLTVIVSTSAVVQSNTLTIKAEDAADPTTTASKNITLNVISGSVSATCTGMQGYVKRDLWIPIFGTSVVSLTSDPNFPNTPNSSSQRNSFEAPTNVADNYGQRMYGLVKAPMTGAYRFYIASDDNSELWLSTNSNSANKIKIAQVSDWTNSREWNKYPSQTSALINLTAGQTYYIEALMKEAGGGDNLAVGWLLPGAGSVSIVPGSCLSSYSTLPPSGSMDTPNNGETVSGNYWVQGWAIDNWTVNETKIQSIKIYLDPATTNTFLGDASLNVGPRTDICNSGLHVGWQDCPNPAWNYLWDTSVVAVGAHTLKAVIQDGNGGSLTLTKNVNVAPTPSTCNPATVGVNQLSGCSFSGTNFNTLVGAPITGPVLSSPAPDNGVPLPYKDWIFSGPNNLTDNYSVRFKGRFNFTSGSYTFNIGSDDGSRVYFDDNLDGTPDSGYLATYWLDRGYSVTTGAPVNVSAGNHVVVYEMYENAGGSGYSLSWNKAIPPSAPVVDLKVNNQDTSVTSPLTVPRKDSSTINLTWLVSNADTCNAIKSTSAPGVWAGAKDKTSGSNSLTGINVAGAHSYTLSCTNAGGTATDTVYISVPVCNPLTFVGGSVSPSSVLASGAYTATCNYGVINNQIFPEVGSGSCVWTNWTGTSANFSCSAGTNVGSFINSCGTFGPIAPDYYCVVKNPINNLNVVPGPTGGPGNLTDAKIAICPVSGVVLTWTAASGANTYNIYRNTHGGPAVILASDIGNVLTYTDITGTAGVLYDYWVEGKDSVSGVTSASKTPANTNSSGIAKNTCGSGSGPVTVTVDNGVCGLITVSWSTVVGATYNVYRNTTGNSPVPGDRIKQGATGNSYSDVTVAGLYYYWVTAVISGSESAFKAPTTGSNPFGLSDCVPNLSSSDKDIVAINGNGLPTSNCNGTDSLPANTQLNLGDKIKFSINLCNSGSAIATGMTVTDKLTNLSMPKTGWNAKYNSGAGEVAIGSVGVGIVLTVTGTAPNQTLTFTKVPNLAKPGATPPAIRRITFEAMLSIPTNFSASSARFQNGFTATFNEGTISRYTPLIQFYTGKGIPSIIEIP